MACTYDITTNRGKVRLKVGDTSTTACVFSDAEIDYFLTQASNNVTLAAAALLKAWAAKYTASATAEKIGDYSYNQKTVDNMLKLAAQLESEDSMTPVFAWSEPDLSNGSGITAEED